MLYPQDIEHKIDFGQIRSWLQDLCSSAVSKEKVQDIQFLTDFEQIHKLISELWEMKLILLDSSLQYAETNIADIRQSYVRIRVEGLFLEEKELADLRRNLQSYLVQLNFFNSLDSNRFPYLIQYISQQQIDFPCANLLSLIDRVIDRYGTIKDNASPQLAQLRHELQQANGSVARVLNSILRQAQAEGMIDQDVAPTLRQGRLVLPVPPAYKRKIGGIVHDESASGKTVFLEPQAVVEANNHIRELESAERRECVRILTELTDQIRPYLQQIEGVQDFLANIDLLTAKAKLAIQTNSICPQLKAEPMLDWRIARHPILENRLNKQSKSIVPLSIKLFTPTQRILVISGPNAGGKSVCLKTVALLQYMLQCGLLVPMREDSTMGIFSNIMIDIGDEQSIEDDLSTYSSHLRNMKSFIRYADSDTLLLIDEFGGGTEPKIGGAMAQAVLEQLNERQSFGVITTHYDNLKHYAQDALGVVNGAMLYDRQHLQPLFELSIGNAGSSFAVEIARQIGLSNQLIERATALVGSEYIDYEKHLHDIAKDKRYWEHKRQQIKQKEKDLQEKINTYDQNLREVRLLKKEIIADAASQAEELIRRSNAAIENTIRQIKESNADKEATQKARAELTEVRKHLEKKAKAKDGNPKRAKQTPKNQEPATAPNATDNRSALTVGSRVRKVGQTMVGNIVELKGRQALVAFGNIQSYIAIKDLEYVSSREAKRENKGNSVVIKTNISNTLRNRQLNFKQELDLRGCRADEALQQLINFIDDAVMVGTPEVRILHGTGTGALREVVRNYLKMQSRVVDFHDAHPDQGGTGITIVQL